MLGAFNRFGLRSPPSAFRIASLFRDGAQGDYWQNAREFYFTRSAGGVYEPVTTTGDQIARFTGSVNGINADQDVVESRPLWGEDGELSYYDSDGVDDFLETPLISPESDKIQVIAGIYKTKEVGVSPIVQNGATGGTSNSFAMYAPHNAMDRQFAWSINGSNQSFLAVANSDEFLAPYAAVQSMQGDLSLANNAIESIVPRINGVTQTTFSVVLTGGVGPGFRNAPLRFGQQGSDYYQGRVYAVLVRFGPVLSLANFARAENRIANRTPGVTL